MPRRGSLGEGTFWNRTYSGFGVGAGVTLLSVRFLERDGGKCRDKGAFDWLRKWNGHNTVLCSVFEGLAWQSK